MDRRSFLASLVALVTAPVVAAKPIRWFTLRCSGGARNLIAPMTWAATCPPTTGAKAAFVRKLLDDAIESHDRLIEEAILRG